MEKALEAYDEALAAFRKLAKANPDAYLPEVATTLSNLVELYRSNGQMEAAEKYTSDLERILDPNWSASSKSSNNQAAKDLQAPALNQEPTASVAEPGTLEGQASATNDPALKHELQELISRLSTSFQS
jgi:tetratricopeptide (TPR) repeat protein